MMRKQFKDIDIYAGIKAQDGAKWIKDNGIVENWKTPEHIEVRPVYTKEDLEGMEHLDLLKSRMHSIAVTWLLVRRDFLLPSTCLHTVVTTLTTLV